MRIYRSPKDGIVEIDLRSFGLKGLFVLMAVTAVVLGYRTIRLRSPLSGATVTWANCYRTDWDALVDSNQGSRQGDIATYSFELSEPLELFGKFKVKPSLADIKVKDGMGDGALAAGTFGLRQVDRPVDSGSVIPTGPDTHVQHWFSIAGTFQRSKIAQKFFIDCDISFATLSTAGNIISKEPTRHLRYRGSARGELIVFAIPVDNDLLHLVIVDLNTNSAYSRANGK